MLKQRRLIDDAVLSVWSKLTDNFSLPPPRSSQTSKRRERLQLENELLETMELDIFMEENVQTAQELYKKLSQETLPSGYNLINSPKLSLVRLEATEDKGLEIEDKLTFKGFQGHHKISNSVVSHYLCSKLRDKIKSVTEVINIAAYLGSKEQLRPMKSS